MNKNLTDVSGEFVGKSVIFLKYLYVVSAILFVAACSNSDPKDSIIEARSLYQNGEYQAAIIELKKTLQQHPNNADARFVLGEIYLGVGDGKGALKELSLAKKYGNSNPQINLLLAKANFQNGEYGETLKITSDFDSLPNDLKVEVMLLRVSAFLGKGENKRAEDLILAVESIDKNNVDLLLVQSRYALSQQKYTKATEYLAILDKIDSENSEGFLLRGMLHLRQSRYQEATDVFERIISKQERNRFSQHEFSARVGNVQALLSMGNKDIAKKAIQDFLVRAPGHPIPLYFDAVLKFDQKNYSSVKNNLQQVLSVIPNHYPSLLLLGAANFADKNFEQANKYLTKFVDRVPAHSYARKLLGVTKLRLNRSSEALAVLKEGVGSTETDSGLLELIGRVAMRSDVKSAVSYFEKAAERKPENIGLRKQLAKVYIASGELDKAIDVLNFVGGEAVLQAEALEVISFVKKQNYVKARLLADKLIKKYSKDSRFYMIRAAIEISAGYKQTAEKYLKKSIDLQDDNVAAMLALAKLNIQSGDLISAAEWFSRVVEIQPNNLQASLGSAEIAERQGFSDKAISILQQAGKDHPNEYIPQAVLAGYFLQKGKAGDARDLLTVALKNLDHPNLWQLLAQSHEILKNWDEARESYKKVISLLPQSTVAYVSLARIYAITGNNHKAERNLKLALKINSSFSPARAGLANLAISDGDYKRANKIGRDLVVRLPTSPLGFLVLANAALAEKKYLQSKQHFITAFSHKPKRNALLRAYAGFQKAGQQEIALEVLLAWLKDYPSDSAARVLLATTYQGAGKFTAAEKQYRQLLKTRPNDPVILNNLALLRLSIDPMEAKKFAMKAYGAAKENVAIADTFGWVLVKTGDYQQGLKILEAAAKANSHPDIHYHLAFALVKVGEKGRAKSLLTTILAGNDSIFSERVSAQQLLSSL